MTQFNLHVFTDKSWRKRQWRYWLSDPFWGALDYICHYSLRVIPIAANAAIGRFLGPLAAKYRFTKEHQRAEHNLAQLRPELSQAERSEMLTQMWQHIGCHMAEYSLLDKLFAAKRVTIINEQVLTPFIEQKQAMIFVFAHTGNWELCGNYVIGYGFDVMGLYHPVRNRFARRIADSARERMGGVIKLIPSGPEAMRKMCKQLAGQGALWLAIDEVKKQQLKVPAFGRAPALHSSNLSFALRLAQRYQATIIPIWPLREPGSRFTITLGQPIKLPPGDEAFQQGFHVLEQQLEKWLKAHTEQWYMLHDFTL